MANYVSYSDLSQVVTKIKTKFQTLDGAYVIKGSKTFNQLPAINTITAGMVGYVYNLSENFTTTADFVEGAGKDYSAGTNVVIVNDAASGDPASYKFDVVSSFVDVSSINDLIEAVADMIAIDDYDPTAAYAVGDIVKKDNILFKFKSAHTAGDPWSSSEVDVVDILTLISTAEPQSLTQEQLNTILGLLD